MSTSVEYQAVNLSYPAAHGSIEALRDISLCVEKGEFLAVIGPSGCGKSSLIRLALGLERTTRGSVLINDQEVVEPRRDVGVVFQAPTLLPWRTVMGNVVLPAQILGYGHEQFAQTANELLQLTGLEEFANKYPYELSGGMQQRVGIVRALIHDPQVLFMDEPFAALDALTRETMSIELQRIWTERPKTIVFVTHNISEAVLLADRILVISARPGKVLTVLENDAPRPRTISSLSEKWASSLALEIRSHLDRAHNLDV